MNVHEALSNAQYEQYIRTHFVYHKDGSITRTDRKGGLGSLDKDGYLILKIKGRQYKAHRIAWLLNYGRFPETELDHINRIRTDNRIENLRESNRRQQIENRCLKPNPKTGVVGITIDDATKGLVAKYTFKLGGRTYRYRTLEEAKEAKECLKRSGGKP